MRVKPSTLEVKFRNGLQDQYTDEQVADYQQDYNQRITRYYKRELSLILENRIDKPDWFSRQESRARKFVKTLGLTAAAGAQITLVDPKTKEYNTELFGTSSGGIAGQAITCHRTGVLVRNEFVYLASLHKKPDAVGQMIVHELVHAAEPFGPEYYRLHNSNTGVDDTAFRQGFMTEVDGSIARGKFFAEAMPEYAAGLYVRRMEDPGCDLVPDVIPVQDNLPDYYTRFNFPPLNNTNGEALNAYALGLIAQQAEVNGTMPRNEFMRRVLGAYSVDSSERIDGLRTLARGTNSLQKGLYAQLRDAPPASPAGAWQPGLDAVQAAIKQS